MEKSKVFFTRTLSAEALVEMFENYGKNLKAPVAIKLHSGEKGNQNYLRPEFLKPLIDKVGGTVVECNTAYEGARNETKKHLKLLKEHGWSELFKFDLMDASGPDIELNIPEGKIINKNYVGKNMANYASMLVVSHFKGHPMGGFGGALKQLSIGCASSAGKAWIHSGGKTKDQNVVWNKIAEQNDFLEAMAEAASSVVEYFKGNMLFINIMCNMSVDCDCCAVAEDPCMEDIGILISTDPIAIDQACLDLVYNSSDPGKEHFIERVESRNGAHILDRAAELNFGSREYELIEV